MTGNSFLVLIQNWHKSVLKIPVANFLITPQTNPEHGRYVALPPEMSVVYGLWIQLLLNRRRKYFWNCA